MEQDSAIEALAALAHATRLTVFRLLVQAGPNGLGAGSIAAAADVPPSTLSHHLSALERGGLVTAQRGGRQAMYAAHYDGVRRLLAFLTEDCCAGHPEVCGTGVTAPSCVPA